MKGKNGWSGGNGGLAVEPRKQRFGRCSGPRRHPGELRRPRFPPPHSAGDMQPSAPQPLFSRRCLCRFRLANEAAYQLPRSARFDASREVPESLQEGHFRAALSASAVRRRQQSAARFFFVSLSCLIDRWRLVDGLWFCRKCGWTGSREGFACQFRRRRCLLLELMTVDTGLGFLLKNLG